MLTCTMEMTFREAVYLSDILSCHAEGPKGQGSPYPELVLKVGSVVLQTDPEQAPVREKAPVRVAVSWPELWLLREVAKSSVTVGQERVGFNIMRKVYQALQELSAAMDVGPALAAPPVDVTEQSATSVKRRLAKGWNGGGGDDASN